MNFSAAPAMRKLGCLPSPPKATDLRLSAYIDNGRIDLSMAPGASDWTDWIRADGGKVQPSRDAYGNLTAGNCVLAAPAHMVTVLGQITGVQVAITAEDVINEYAKRTGYNPVTGENDNGWFIRDMLSAWRKDGLFNGKAGKIDAFALVNHLNPQEVAIANWLGCGTLDGYALPVTAQGQLDDQGRELWAIPPNGFPPGAGPGSWGGHCVWKHAVSPFLHCGRTWGGPGHMRADWFEVCCFESWIAIHPWWVLRTGRVPNGFAYDQLLADVRARSQG